MTHEAWTAAIFRIFAVWLACEILIRVPGTLSGVFDMTGLESAPPLSSLLLPATVTWTTSALIVVVLWRSSNRLAELVWQGAPATGSRTDVNLTSVPQAVLLGFGVYLVVHGLPNLTGLAAGYYTLPTGFGLEQSYAGRLWARAIGVGVQMAVGVSLIVYSRPMAQWLIAGSRLPDDSQRDA
jgi:hypothetical protein